MADPGSAALRPGGRAASVTGGLVQSGQASDGGYHASGFPVFASIPERSNDQELPMPESMAYTDEGVYDNTPAQLAAAAGGESPYGTLLMPSGMAYSDEGVYDNPQALLMITETPDTPDTGRRGVTKGRLKAAVDSKPARSVDVDVTHKSAARMMFEHGIQYDDPDRGQPCTLCDTCPGFDMHYWRKICKWCRCPRACHRSTEVEERRANKRSSQQSDVLDLQELMTGEAEAVALKQKKYAWIPLGLSAKHVELYFAGLPPDNVPIIGSIGEVWRHRQLLLQLPPHDTDFKLCDQLTDQELERFQALDDLRLSSHFEIGEVIPCPDFSSPPDCPECFLRDDGTHWPYCSKFIEPKPKTALQQAALQENVTEADFGLPPVRSIKEMRRGKKGKSKKAVEVKVVKTSPAAPAEPAKPLAVPSGGRCRGCCEPLLVGEMVVTVGRFKEGIEYFHPRCFMCSECFELLVDLRCYIDVGAEERRTGGTEQRLFCGRHWADNIKPRCKACDETIHQSSHVFEMDGPWHLRHFCCYICDANLTKRQRYVPRDGKPLCFACYAIHIADKCTSCGGAINPLPGKGGKISIKNRHWHTACFSCKKCGCKLEGKPAVPHGDVLYCKKCYKRLLRAE